MTQLGEEIKGMSAAYFAQVGEDVPDALIALLIESITDEYKTLRAYPDSYTDAMIDSDVERYFGTRKANIAVAVIPELFGKIGAEGLSDVTDNGIIKTWLTRHVLNDVLPICEVV